MSRYKLQGFFEIKSFDAQGKLLAEVIVPNGITKWGARDFLNLSVRPKNIPQSRNWHMGLIDGPKSGVTLSRDDETGHFGGGGNPPDPGKSWTEDIYSGDRKEIGSANWSTVSGAETARRTVAVTFDIDQTGTCAGIFITYQELKEPSIFTQLQGDIFCTALVATDVPVSSGGTVEATYTIQIFNSASYGSPTEAQAPDTSLTIT